MEPKVQGDFHLQPAVESPKQALKNKLISRKLTSLQVGIVFTVFILLILGITFSISWQFRVLDKISTPNVNVSSDKPKSLTLELTSPGAESVVVDNKVTVKGRTLPGIPVVCYTDTHDNSLESDASGNFSGTLLLDKGINTLTVTAMGDNDEEKTLTMDIVYDDQVLGVKTDKSNNSEKQKSSFSGQLEKITAKQIEVVDNNNTSQTIFIDSSTRIVNEKGQSLRSSALKQNLKTISVTSDEIASDGAKFKRAIKIYVKTATASGQLKISKRQAIQGVVLENSGSIITIMHQTHTDRRFSVKVNKDTVIKMKGVIDTSITSIMPGLRIIAIGDNTNGGEIVASRIHVIPGKAFGLDQLSITPSASASPTINVSPTSGTTISATPSFDISPTEGSITATLTPTITGE